jgi:hypothetical protein
VARMDPYGSFSFDEYWLIMLQIFVNFSLPPISLILAAGLKNVLLQLEDK